MPILLIFALIAACSPINWPPPFFGFGGGMGFAVASTVAVVALSLSVAIGLQMWVVWELRRDPGRKAEIVSVYSRLRRLMFFANVGMVALCVVVFGWGWATGEVLRMEWHGKSELAPFAELAVPLPYFLILFGTWTIYYDSERALIRTTVHGPIQRAFFGRAGYFLHQLRQFGLLVLMPVIILVAQRSIDRFLPDTARSDWFLISMMALVVVLILLMPLVVKPILGLKRMPAGPIRDRLEVMANRLHFRCTDILLWPTHGASTNAMIVGLLPRIRYVIFTDRILEEMPPDELNAVFGHEVGHAKHGHIPHYAAFLSLSMAVLAAVLLLVAQALEAKGVELSESAKDWIALPPVVLIAVYIFLVFGYLSRRCERQADVYGCRSVSCDDPNCAGHDHATVYPERARGLCPTGIRTFVRALERVEHANVGGADGLRHGHRTLGEAIRGFFKWLRSWQHSTIARRVEFLLGLSGDPQRERRFQWHVTILRWGLLAGLVAAFILLGQAVGWRKILGTM